MGPDGQLGVEVGQLAVRVRRGTARLQRARGSDGERRGPALHRLQVLLQSGRNRIFRCGGLSRGLQALAPFLQDGGAARVIQGPRFERGP